MSNQDKQDPAHRLSELIRLRSEAASSSALPEPQDISSWADLELIANPAVPPPKALASFSAPLPERNEMSSHEAAGGYSGVPVSISIGDGKLNLTASWTKTSFKCTWTYSDIDPNTHLLFLFRDERTGSLLGHVFDAGQISIGAWDSSPAVFDADLAGPWRLEILPLD